MYRSLAPISEILFTIPAATKKATCDPLLYQQDTISILTKNKGIGVEDFLSLQVAYLTCI